MSAPVFGADTHLSMETISRSSFRRQRTTAPTLASSAPEGVAPTSVEQFGARHDGAEMKNFGALFSWRRNSAYTISVLDILAQNCATSAPKRERSKVKDFGAGDSGAELLDDVRRRLSGRRTSQCQCLHILAPTWPAEQLGTGR
jgi:hypothetical protein